MARELNPTQEHLVELREQVSRFPKLPGVYIMRDEHGEVIYVGKARELRSRVRCYFGVGDDRLEKLVIAHLDAIE